MSEVSLEGEVGRKSGPSVGYWNVVDPTTQWSTKLSSTPDFGVLRDQICITYGLRVHCVRQVDF